MASSAAGRPLSHARRWAPGIRRERGSKALRPHGGVRGGWSSAAQASTQHLSARFDRQPPWPTAGTSLGRQNLRDAPAPARRFNRRQPARWVVLACIQLAQARIQIATHRFHD